MPPNDYDREQMLRWYNSFSEAVRIGSELMRASTLSDQFRSFLLAEAFDIEDMDDG